MRSRFIEMFGCIGKDEKQWGLKSLKDCVEVNPQKSKDPLILSNSIEEVSFVPMAFVGENGSIDCSCIKNYDEVKSGFTYFKENDVLFAKITPCMENGKGCIAKGLHNGIGFGSTEFHVLRPLDNLCNPKWLYYVSTSQEMRRSAEKKMTGSAGQRRVPAKFLEDFKISIPPIELQKQFATFVSQVDKSKFLLQQMIAKLELLKKSRFIEMFKNSQKVNLKDVSEITMGQSPDSITYNTEKDGLPFFQGKTEFKEKYIGTPSVWCNAPKKIANSNDILMSVRAPVGDVNITLEKCCIGRGLASIRAKNISTEYLFFALSLLKDEIESKGVGSTFKAINKDIIESIQIPSVDKKLQNDFSEFFIQIDKSKAILQKQLDDLVGSNK